jgi:predicted amidohydrolase YtcJ
MIAHIELLRPADGPRFARAGVVAVVQPIWSSPEGPLGGPFVRSVLGRDRARRTFPLGALERAGATLAFGSDWRVSTQDPLRILDAATRLAWDPVSEAVGYRAATEGAATAVGVEGPAALRAGRVADLTLIAPGPDGGLAGGRVVATVVEGSVVHADAEARERGLRDQ